MSLPHPRRTKKKEFVLFAGEVDRINGALESHIVRVRINPEDRDEHPAVIISPNHVVKNPRVRKLNVLYCPKLPPAHGIEPTQFSLNSADGLDFRSPPRTARFIT
jgi:hypothetical protein